MGRSAEEIKKDIESGNTALGIEFGSTRIMRRVLNFLFPLADRAGEL